HPPHRQSPPYFSSFSTPMPPPPRPTLFPYTTLFRSLCHTSGPSLWRFSLSEIRSPRPPDTSEESRCTCAHGPAAGDRISEREKRDRKSTRLNSSHVSISYAVFCLKKKRSQRVTCDVE